MNAKWLNANSKKCPECKAPIQKNDGCNWMTCYACHKGFCWLCMGDDSNHEIWFGTHRRPCNDAEEVRRKGREAYLAENNFDPTEFDTKKHFVTKAE